MKVINKTTLYWSFKEIKYFLVISWSLVIVFSVFLFHLGLAIPNDVLRTTVSTLRIIYPALGYELAQLPVPRYSPASPMLVGPIFIIQTISLYTITFFHYYVMRKFLKSLNPDSYIILIGFLICVFTCFTMSNLASKNYDFYADVIDSNGFFIVKRTVVSAFLSYFSSTVLCNVHILILRVDNIFPKASDDRSTK